MRSEWSNNKASKISDATYDGNFNRSDRAVKKNLKRGKIVAGTAYALYAVKC
jgi:hypothetical protein